MSLSYLHASLRFQHHSPHVTMDQQAQTAQGHEESTSAQTNAQPEGSGATPAQPAPDANATPMQHGDFSNLPMQPGMPTDLNLLSMLPQDGSLLGPEALMNMPMMMPMMMPDGSMDANGMLSMPQNGISNGKPSTESSTLPKLTPSQMRSHCMTDKYVYGAWRPNKRSATPTCCSSQ